MQMTSARWPHLSCFPLTGAPQPAPVWVPQQSPWCKALAQLQPSALSQWPAREEEMFLLMPIAALPPDIFPGEENAKDPPIYPKTSNCILLHSLCRVFW